MAILSSEDGMSTTALIMRRFNLNELAVQRLFRLDPAFKSLCDDYATACCALERWQADRVKSEDYRALIEELEGKISDFLAGSMGNSGANAGNPG